jgi:hypothetical protein
MATQSIIQPELFKSLIEIDVNDFCIDLHNDYDCTQLKFSGTANDLLLSFSSIRDNSKYPLVTLKFEEVELVKMLINLQTRAACNTIDHLYRCRCMQNGELVEYSANGKSFYSLEFCEGYHLELFSTRLLLVLQ